MQQRAPTILSGRYELGLVLGSGGMATVYRALDRQLGREVAVKVLADNLGRDRAFVERFRREAQAAAGLAHPNLVTVFDTGSDGDLHYIVMELVQGETLAERIRREGALPEDEAIRVAVGVCRALEAAHERGLVHRDVKPGNVMLGDDGRVRLVDLGIARIGGLDTLTTTGVVLGSSTYLSPEQAGGAPGDERSDVYALGCVLFEMLTGRPPFTAPSPVAILYLHVNEDPRPPSALTGTRSALDAVVMRCLAKEPSGRYGSAAEVEAALLASTEGGGRTMPLPAIDSLGDTAPVDPLAGHGRRGPRWVGIAVALVLIALVAVVIALWSEPFRPRADARRSAIVDHATAPAPTSVRAAWGALVSTIAAGVLDGGIEEATADTLRDRAEAILDGYQAEDHDATRSALTAFRSTLARGLEGGEVSTDASIAIDEALLELVDALRREGALARVESFPAEAPVLEPSEDPGRDSGSKDEEDHGPPPHAEANGHDDD